MANAFTLSTLVQYEPFVTDTLSDFLAQLNQKYADKSGAQGICDISDWCMYFALDVVSALTMGRTYGILGAGSDHIGVIKAQKGLFKYFSIANNAPWLDRVFKKNPILLWLGRTGLWNSVTATVPVAQRQVAELSRNFKGSGDEPQRERIPLLTKFLQAKVNNPEIVDDRAVLGLTLSMVNAGSTTVSTTLVATLYFLLKNPAVMEQLIAELDANFPPPNIAIHSQKEMVEYVVPFVEAQKLSFLDAVMKEVFRLWPALGMQLMERVTPPEGAHIMDEYIPGNTIVSCNAWILHRLKSTYGEDADEFRPSRWLQANPDQLLAMNKSMLGFGAGPHTCIGKNIGLLELYKAVPSLLRIFTVSPSLKELFYYIIFNAYAIVQIGRSRKVVENYQFGRGRSIRSFCLV